MLCGSSHADIFRPAYLEIRETGADTYDVLWKVPSLGSDQRLATYVRFPDSTEHVTTPSPFISDGAWIERWEIRHAGGLVGEVVSIEGNAAGVSDVIARVERLDGTSQVERLGLDALQFEVRAPAGTAEIAWSYTVLVVVRCLRLSVCSKNSKPA